MRCYIRPEEWDRAVLLDAEESHHLLHVLRAEPGLRLEVFDGQGRTGSAEFLEAQGKRALIHLLEQRVDQPPLPRLVLYQALTREQRMDLILQKSVELGVQEIVPLATTNCVVRLREDQAEDKRARWEKILLNAAKQSGAAFLPDIAKPCTLPQALARAQGGRLLIGDLSDKARPLHEVLREAREAPPGEVGILIGPEGDFTPEEREQAIAAGAQPVNLGPHVLRTETAALFALSILRYEFHLS